MLHDVERFVFTSSIAVYGAGQVPMTEEMVPQPEDPYGISKYAVELDLAAAHEMFGLDYTVFRPHNVYGERQNIADRYRNVIGIFMNNILRGEPMPVFGDGLQTRAFSHIADVAPIIAARRSCRRRTNEVFNIGADQPYTILELARGGRRARSASSRSSRTCPPRNEVVHAFSDHTKVQQAFSPPEPLDLQGGIDRRRRGSRSTAPASRSSSRERSRSSAACRRPGASPPVAEPGAGRAPRLALVVRELLRRSPGTRPPPLRRGVPQRLRVVLHGGAPRPRRRCRHIHPVTPRAGPRRGHRRLPGSASCRCPRHGAYAGAGVRWRAARGALALGGRSGALAIAGACGAASPPTASTCSTCKEYWTGRFDVLASTLQVPVVAGEHGGSGGLHVHIFKRRALAQAAAITVQSTAEKERLARVRPRRGADHQQCRRLTSSLRVPRWTVHQRVLAVARLDNTQKRISDLISAVARLPAPWGLDIVGHGPDEAALLDVAARAGRRPGALPRLGRLARGAAR